MADQVGERDQQARLGPGRWAGNENDFTEWKYDMEQWARRHDASLPQLLVAAENAPGEIDPNGVTGEHKKFAGKFMTDLAGKTEGKAKRLLMSLTDKDNGNEN